MDEKEEVRLYGENKKKDDEKWKMRRQMKEKGNKVILGKERIIYKTC